MSVAIEVSGELAQLPKAEADPAQLRMALQEHHAGAWRWALRCARGDTDTAMEALQDGYVAVLQGRAAFAGRSSFKTWLFAIVRRCVQRVHRRRLLSGWIFEPVERAETLVAPPPPPPRNRALERGVAGLPARQREIIALVFEHDLTVEEAAAAMQISVGSARQHYARAKAKLRAVLTEKGDSNGRH